MRNPKFVGTFSPVQKAASAVPGSAGPVFGGSPSAYHALFTCLGKPGYEGVLNDRVAALPEILKDLGGCESLSSLHLLYPAARSMATQSSYLTVSVNR